MTEFTRVYQALSAIMQPYAEQLDCKTDSETDLYVDTRHVMNNGKPLWFGGVQIKKRYVSYHLMPVYVNPDLLASLTPELKKRMQGKSCFNFTSVDAALFKELAVLTEAGYRDYRRQGFV
jgi:hypothetical protein